MCLELPSVRNEQKSLWGPAKFGLVLVDAREDDLTHSWMRAHVPLLCFVCGDNMPEMLPL
jgi:hypothetical protein